MILLDEGVFQDEPLSELLRQLTRTAPVILLASAERQGEILRMVAEGEVEFVARRFYPVGRVPGGAALALGAAVGDGRGIASGGNAGRRGGNFPARDQQSAYGNPGQRGVAAFSWCAIARGGYAAAADRGGPGGAVARNHPAAEWFVG